MIIGVLGLIGSGKNTAAEILVKQLPQAQIDSFAGTLKDAVAHIFSWDREMLEGATPESRAWREQVDEWWADRLGMPNLTPRWVLQNFGTDVMRNCFHEDIWIASLERKLLDRGGHTVLADVRFRNEVELIRKMGGTLVEVQRGSKPEWYQTALAAVQGDTAAYQRMTTQYGDVHRSEWDWAGTKVDYTINNDGTLEDLEAAIKDLIDYV